MNCILKTIFEIYKERTFMFRAAYACANYDLLDPASASAGSLNVSDKKLEPIISSFLSRYC